jgi:hypothetical protein
MIYPTLRILSLVGHMGNFFYRNDVEEIKNELLKTLKSVPQEREKVEEAVSLAIKLNKTLKNC